MEGQREIGSSGGDLGGMGALWRWEFWKLHGKDISIRMGINHEVVAISEGRGDFEKPKSRVPLHCKKPSRKRAS
jgi:hypothetical protein